MTGEGGIREDYIPGDLGFDPLGLKPQEEAALKVMKTKELNHGRLAVSVGIPSLSCPPSDPRDAVPLSARNFCSLRLVCFMFSCLKDASTLLFLEM